MYKAFLSLGSNLGERENNLKKAVEEIDKNIDISITGISNIYETEPVGYVEQGRFLNMVVAVETSLVPIKLLKELQQVEKKLKRTREIHWGPRTIDIDILTFEDLEINLPDLVIPHPRMFERAFVLIPLMDLCVNGNLMSWNLRDYIERCADKSGVVLYKKF